MRLEMIRAQAWLYTLGGVLAFALACAPVDEEHDPPAANTLDAIASAGDSPEFPQEPLPTGRCCIDNTGHSRLLDANGKPVRLCPPALEHTATDSCPQVDEGPERVCCFDEAGVPRYGMQGLDGPIDTAQACDTSHYVTVGNLPCPRNTRLPEDPPPTECEDAPAECCSGPDGLYTVESILYSQTRRTVVDRVPSVRIVNGRRIIKRDENGDIVYEEGPPREVEALNYQACKPTCAGVTDVGACECEEVRCCEDEENGDLYAEYGMPDGRATVLFEQSTDPDTGHVSRVMPKRCPRACPDSLHNIGYCAQTCEHPIISATPRPPKKPEEEDPEERKPEEFISCDECPSDPDTARQTLCDPCPPEVDLGLFGDELARYCAQLPAELLAEPTRFAEELKAQVRAIDAQLQAATRAPRSALEKVQKALLDALGASGFDSLSLPGAPPNLCDSTDPSYANCLRDYIAKVNAFIARPPGGVTLPPSGVSAWRQFEKAANAQLPSLDAAQKKLTDAITAAQSAGLNITTQYDDFVNRTLARIGKQPLGTLCAGLTAEALEECIDDALHDVQEELNRLSKACKPDTSRSDSCEPRYCEGEAANRAKEQLDDLDTLPGDGLGWNEFPKDACCTKGSADFRVNSDPKQWQGGQFFTRSTSMGSWGWGWSAHAPGETCGWRSGMIQLIRMMAARRPTRVPGPIWPRGSRCRCRSPRS